MKAVPRIAVAWSSGKDAAWALHRLRETGAGEPCVLVTTFNEAAGRVSMHGVRRELVEAQARAAGLPLLAVDLPAPCPNAVYEARMRAAIARLRAEHAVTHMAFGDLFLADVRAYRERMLEGTGITPRFPLWGEVTTVLARAMLAGGAQALLSCVDTRVLGAEFAGRAYDHDLLAALPAGIDPCGERGEFHTVATAGPAFAYPLELDAGEVVLSDGFAFADFRLRR